MQHNKALSTQLPLGPHNSGSDHFAPANLLLCRRARYCIQATINGTKITATIVISLMRILRLGPEVSLKGSPTVSPITAALCGSEPLPPW